MKEINPEDVPQMMLDGTLKFGMELEFSQSFGGPDGVHNKQFAGFVPDRVAGYVWIAIDPDKNWELLVFRQARFPLPRLSDGDPVFCWDFDQVWEEKRHFEKFVDDMVIAYTGSSFTGKVKHSYHNWRMPTEQELLKAGYTEAQINEMLTRWGVSGTTRVG